MNLLEIKKFDINNGPGVRTSIWVSGCTTRCEGCFSKHTWNPDQGTSYKLLREDIIDLLKNPYTDGISILGGDPAFWLFVRNDGDLVDLLKLARQYRKSVWMWTGYNYELFFETLPGVLEYIDIMVDGKFIQNLFDPSLLYRGSSNQRVIDVKTSIKTGEITLLI